jgi:hypothetical protein
MKSKEKINFKIISNKINSNQKKGQLWKSRKREKRKEKVCWHQSGDSLATHDV